jgi:PKD domain
MTEIGVMCGATALALIGIGLAWLFYGGGYRDPSRKFAAAVPRLVKLVQDKFRIDELYQFLFVRPIKRLAEAIYFVVDRILIDKILVGVPVAAVDFFGRVARMVQGSGDGQRYMAVFAFGAAALVFLGTQPDLFGSLKVTVTGRTVDVDARDGKTGSHPLEYSFDFDGDGKPEVEGAAPSARHDYPRPGTYTVRVRVKDTRWGTSNALEQKVEVP